MRLDRQGPITRWLMRQGEDPDPRFSLANERTFLAWVRTALALMGAGIAVELFAVEKTHDRSDQVLAIALVALSMLTGVASALRWVRVELAMRRSQTLPTPALMPVLVLLIVVGGVVFIGTVVGDLV